MNPDLPGSQMHALLSNISSAIPFAFLFVFFFFEEKGEGENKCS